MTPESEPCNTGKRNGTLRRVTDGRQSFSQTLPAAWRGNLETQLLSRHGYFCKYLCKTGKKTRHNCIYCDTSIYDAEHTFFHSERWVLKRRNLEAKVDAFTIENFCNVNLSSEEYWNSMVLEGRSLQKYIENLL